VELTRTGAWNLATRVLLGIPPIVGTPAAPARVWVDSTVRSNVTYVYLVNAVVQDKSAQQGVPVTTIKTSFAASRPITP
jgi:hypothetical protein